MKVFFVASTHLKDFSIARKIYAVIESLGHVHTDHFAKDVDVEYHRNADSRYWSSLYSRTVKNISRSDICVFEMSARSVGLGQLVQEALSQEKPIILLSGEDEEGVSGFMSGTANEEKRVQWLKYDMNNIKDVLEYGFEIAEELLTVRFTMLMPAEMVKFLDGVKDRSGVSRSEYIRQLISEKMEGK